MAVLAVGVAGRMGRRLYERVGVPYEVSEDSEDSEDSEGSEGSVVIDG